MLSQACTSFVPYVLCRTGEFRLVLYRYLHPGTVAQVRSSGCVLVGEVRLSQLLVRVWAVSGCSLVREVEASTSGYSMHVSALVLGDTGTLPFLSACRTLGVGC